MPALFLQARMASRWPCQEGVRKLDANSHRSASSYNSTCKPVSGKTAGTHAVDGLPHVDGLHHVVYMSLVQAIVLDHVVCGWIVCECVIKPLHVVSKRGDQAVSVI